MEHPGEYPYPFYIPIPILNSYTHSDILQPVSDVLLYRAHRKALTESMSLQEFQPRNTGTSKAEEATREAVRQGSILSSSLPTGEAYTVSAETCCQCCKCRCHQTATPTSPPTAPPTMHKVDKDKTSPISYSQRSPTKPCGESPFQWAAVGSEGWSSTDPRVRGAFGGDTPPLEGEDKTHDGEQGGGSETEKETGSNKLNEPLGIDVSKQEGGSNGLKQQGGSKEPEESGPREDAGVNEPTQEVEVNEIKHEVESTVPEHDRSVEKSGSGRSVESSEAIHDPLPDKKPPPPTGPTPQPTPPPKECPPVLPTATPLLPDTPTTVPFPQPHSGPTKEDDYSTVADALALAEGEHVLVCQRPSVAVTSPCTTQLPSQFRALASGDYCEVIFANKNEQTPRLEAEAQGGQGVKRVRTLPRQVRQDKEEVYRVKERSFSLRGKPAHPQGRRPLDLLPTQPPLSVQEETVAERSHHGDTTEDAAIPTEGPRHICSPTCRHGATFHIVEENPAISDQQPKSVFSPTSPTDGRGPPAVEGVGQGRPPPPTVYAMVSFKKKIRNRSEGEKDELDEAPMHFSVDASLPTPTTPAPHIPGKSAKSPSSPNKGLPSHIPISRNQSCPIKSPPSQVASRRAPRGDYEEVDVPKKGGVHAAYEEVKPSRIPTPRRQNPSPK